MTWLALALFCAFSVATADALTKKKLSDYGAPELTIIRFGATAVLLAPVLVTVPFDALPRPFWLTVGALLPLEIAANLLYMSAVRSAPLSLTLPYLAFTPAMVAVSGYLLLGEVVSPAGAAGIGLVVVGAYALNASVPSEPARGWLRPVTALAKTAGSRKMLGVAVLYSITSALGKRCLEYLPGVQFAAFYYALLGLVTLVLFSVTGKADPRIVVRRPLVHLGIGVTMAAMIVSHFLALERIEVAYFISVKRTSLLFGILYGALLFQEPKLSKRLIAGAVMVAGVALVSSG